MTKSAKNTRFRMTKQQDAVNKRMREEIKLQRRKRLWQKRRSPISGIGLFAALPIRADTPIIEFKGRVIPWEEGALMLLRGANHVIRFDAKHDMDARPQWSPAAHVNHGCYPNCAIKKKRGGLWLTSIRPIEQGEELLIDYDFDLGEEFEQCKCGHPRCRGLMLRRKDWPKLRRLMSKIL
jgi:SET domain-containing protein